MKPLPVMTPGVTLPYAVEAAIVGHARQAAPHECCGLLLGNGDAIVDSMPARNIDDDPTRRYLIDPRHHLDAIRAARARSLEVIGAYHSHPRSSARPSPTDAAAAFQGFLFLIVGLAEVPPEITGWLWVNGNFASVPLVRFRKG